MSPDIAKQIQDEQDHGRQKYGSGPNDLAHDDEHSEGDWICFIRKHTDYACHGTPMEYRQQLVKVAGLAVSAIEAFDRKREGQLRFMKTTCKNPKCQAEFVNEPFVEYSFCPSCRYMIHRGVLAGSLAGGFVVGVIGAIIKWLT